MPGDVLTRQECVWPILKSSFHNSMKGGGNITVLIVQRKRTSYRE
jgi:hypothetical protein